MQFSGYRDDLSRTFHRSFRLLVHATPTYVVFVVVCIISMTLFTVLPAYYHNLHVPMLREGCEHGKTLFECTCIVSSPHLYEEL